jgi:hypothetical protein
MSRAEESLGRVVCGAGGALLIVSLLLGTGGAMADVYLLIVAAAAIGTALTGGNYGLFRPDLSLRGAADLLGVVSTVVLAWLLAVDGASEFGAFLALAGAMAVAAGSGDYAVLRGAPAFPRTTAGAAVSRRRS